MVDRFIEKMRKAYSPDSVYQHLLDTIADSIEEEFGPVEVNAEVRVSEITAFIRRWRP